MHVLHCLVSYKTWGAKCNTVEMLLSQEFVIISTLSLSEHRAAFSCRSQWIKWTRDEWEFPNSFNAKIIFGSSQEKDQGWSQGEDSLLSNSCCVMSSLVIVCALKTDNDSNLLLSPTLPVDALTLNVGPDLWTLLPKSPRLINSNWTFSIWYVDVKSKQTLKKSGSAACDYTWVLRFLLCGSHFCSQILDLGL